MLAIVLFLVWIIGSWLTAKADAVLTNQATEWENIVIGLFCWPIIAVCICCSKHTIYFESRHREYHY